MKKTSLLYLFLCLLVFGAAACETFLPGAPTDDSLLDGPLADLSPEQNALFLAGDVAFAVDQQPYLQGYLPVVFFALKVRNGNDVGGGQPVYSGPGFVTKDNAAQVKQFAAAGTR